MISLQNVACCGIKEISGLSNHRTPELALKDFVAQVYRSGNARGGWQPGIGTGDLTKTILPKIVAFTPRFRYAIFSQAGVQAKYGVTFAKFIEDNKLGKVVRADSKFHKNPNSGNMLTAWIWTLDEKAIDAWLKESLKVSKTAVSGAEVTEAVNGVQ